MKAPAGEYKAEPVRANRMPNREREFVDDPSTSALTARVRYLVQFPSTSNDVADRMSLCRKKKKKKK